MILLIDNYDSFTYNLYHYLILAGAQSVVVKRNDQIDISQIQSGLAVDVNSKNFKEISKPIFKPRAIVISPGPCTPDEAGICLDVIKNFAGKIPIFGVCLGHQAIGQAFGGKIVKTYPMHGKISEIHHNGENVFADLPSPFQATRYHSLIIESQTCPKNLKITATTSEKEGKIIMGIADEERKIYGVQFHPESIATKYGQKIIENFLRACS
jgi:anthranilate synthase/aminodeoxychorismate synthase-like glutamine amidotransferase